MSRSSLLKQSPPWSGLGPANCGYDLEPVPEHDVILSFHDGGVNRAGTRLHKVVVPPPLAAWLRRVEARGTQLTYIAARDLAGRTVRSLG